jgi:hypothetical protein
MICLICAAPRDDNASRKPLARLILLAVHPSARHRIREAILPETVAPIKSITPQLLLAALRVPVKTQKLCHNTRHHVESTSSKWYGLPLINVCNT